MPFLRGDLCEFLKGEVEKIGKKDGLYGGR